MCLGVINVLKTSNSCFSDRQCATRSRRNRDVERKTCYTHITYLLFGLSKRLEIRVRVQRLQIRVSVQEFIKSQYACFNMNLLPLYTCIYGIFYCLLPHAMLSIAYGDRLQYGVIEMYGVK